jgi:hypothetical protein
MLICVIGISGCDSSSGGGLPTVPSSPTPPPVASLTGTWTGLIGGQTLYGLRWTATQEEAGVSGALQLGPGIADNVTAGPQGSNLASGTMSLTLSGTGNQVTVTLSFPARVGNQGPGGAFGTVGAPTCAMTGTGTGNASATSMSGNVTLTWTGGCSPNVTTSPGGQLSMVKQ